jgi:hypothetical protein
MRCDFYYQDIFVLYYYLLVIRICNLYFESFNQFNRSDLYTTLLFYTPLQYVLPQFTRLSGHDVNLLHILINFLSSVTFDLY